jgi:hypothetical protein
MSSRLSVLPARQRAPLVTPGRLLAALVLAASLSCDKALAPSVEIVLSQPAVDFRAVRGSVLTTSRTIIVANGGGGRLGPVSCPAAPATWLACAVTNGNTVTLTANPTGLTTTPAPAAVVISAPGAADHPQTVQATLVIEQPVLTLSATALTFTGSEGSSITAPTAATVSVSNTGAGTLGSLGTVSCTPTPADAHVSCIANQGTGVLSFTIDPTGLAAGTHVFPVRVSAPNDNLAKTVTLTLALSARPRIVLSPPAVQFEAIRGSVSAPPQAVTVSNGGGGTLGTVACPASPAAWLSCSVSGATITLAANPTGLVSSPAAASVAISAASASNSPQALAVTLAILQPVLSVSASTVAFTALTGGTTTTPASATVAVTNTGAGGLASLGAVSCSPVVAGTPVTCAVDQQAGVLTFSVNPVGVASGTHLYDVLVSAPNSSVTRIITVSFAINAPPTLRLTPAELHFSAIRGSTTNQVKTVTVSNAGGGTLGTITCPPNPDTWLTCVVTNSTTLTFTASPTGLTASPLDVTVPVSAVGAANTPQNVEVAFAIGQPVLTLSTSIANFTAATGAGTATPATVVVTASNSGAGTLASLGTISCSPSSVVVSCGVNGTTGALTLSVNPTGLAAGVHVYVVTVSTPNQANAAQTVTIVLTIS